jgi:hypothetical protein
VKISSCTTRRRPVALSAHFFFADTPAYPVALELLTSERAATVLPQSFQHRIGVHLAGPVCSSIHGKRSAWPRIGASPWSLQEP